MTAERALFKFSILYLFALFGALVADRMLLA
jgi:heme o synthase